MQRKICGTSALTRFVLVVALGAAWQAHAQDAKTPYPNMAPLDQYLMERDAEIALARSAAVESISRDAEVMVLGRHGYETVVKGKNGFVCMVQRSWTAGIDDPDFWNPKLRAAICFNPCICPSSQMPVQPWVMRPSRVTPVASTKAAASPPAAKRP